MLPAYHEGSIVNLMSSILGAFGGGSRGYEPLRDLPVAELSRARNVVLLVIDGLGYNFLLRHGENSHLARYLRGSMTSVFPTTTATAISTFTTGLAPQQHAVTGWFTYLKELGCVWTVMPFKSRHPASLHTPTAAEIGEILQLPPVFDAMQVETYAITHQRIVNSAYSIATSGKARRCSYETVEEFFECTGKAVHGNGNAKYVYGYWPELDALCHKHGVGSDQALAHFNELDRAFGRFLESLSGTETTVVVTADHGLLDTDTAHTVMLSDHPELQETLTLPLCGEPRVAYCYVRPGKTRQFEDYVKNRLGECCQCLRSDELVEQGYFGLNRPNPRLFERIGDYALIMNDNYILKDYVYGEKPFSQVGVHGGISDDEMLVPLVVANIS